MATTALTPSTSYTIGRELIWLEENVFHTKSNEFHYIYGKVFKGLHSPNMSSFLGSIIVTLSSVQLQNSLCYRNIVSDVTGVQTNKFANFCNSHKIMLAVVGAHAPFVHQCPNLDELAPMIKVIESYTAVADFYKYHLTTLEKSFGFNFNVIWPDQLNNEHAIDLFLRKAIIE